MRARASLLAAAASLLLWLAPAAARADFGFQPGAEGFAVTPVNGSGEVASLSGQHPFAITTRVGLRLAPESPAEPGIRYTEGDLRDLSIDLPPGLVENPEAVPRCSQVLFHTPRTSPYETSQSGESCPPATQIGVVTVRSSAGGGSSRTFGVFNLVPPAGFPSQFGFNPYGVPITFTPRLRESESEYGLTLELHDFPQQLDVYGFELTIWGTPWDVAHNGQRGECLNEEAPSHPFGLSDPFGKCQPNPPLRQHALEVRSYLTLPTDCTAPLVFRARASSWQGAQVEANSSSPAPSGCERGVPFNPRPALQLPTNRTTSASGLAFSLDGEGESLVDPGQRGESQARRAVVTLPEGFTVNPSVGAGLGSCTPAQYAAETLTSPPGAGCPNASKIGELEVQSPLFEGPLKGSLFLAEPDDPNTTTPGAENPFDALIALYMVAKAPERGVMVRVAGEVAPNPASGQLTATFEGLPQLPYTHFTVRFRDGQRSPLATASACGTYFSPIDLTPWRDPSPRHYTYPVELSAGIGGGPCPDGSVPPFAPQARGGTLNRNAGSYTPFYLHLTRTDGEQEITRYSAELPPGLLGKLKGIPYCPDAAISAAKRRSGFAEQANPSCPAASSIGHTTSGYGLGTVLAYAPGGLYLAGPYHGAPLSIVAIDSATVGPFDLGVIVVRSAIRVDPTTARVSIDSTASDPIPHIIRGIPIHLRDVRVYIDRPNFTVNPTSCEPFTLASTLSGSGASFADPGDDSSATATVPFQVSNCSALGFKPRISLQIYGPTRRGAYPALRAVVRPRPGDANIGRAAVALPPSEFLAQEHIETICTRPQFAREACPAGSVYGHARAVTPLLGAPLEGPVYLRASDNLLPDLVAALRGAGGIKIDVVGRIDAVRGGMRATFDVLPDAPVTKFTMALNGGRKGILVNAEDVCGAAPADARMAGQNNVGIVLRPRLVDARCAKERRGRR